MRFVGVTVVATALAFTGCSGPAAYLAAPASDADLANDGSSAAQDALRDKYGLVVIDETMGTKGGVKNRAGSDVVPVSDRNAARVLASSPDAAEEINNWAFGQSTLGTGARSTFVVAGALTGLSLGYFVGGGFDVTQEGSATVVDATNIALGGVTGAFAAAAILLAADALAEGQANVSLEAGVNAYNRDLDERIERAAKKPAVPSEPAATTTPSDPAACEPSAPWGSLSRGTFAS